MKKVLITRDKKRSIDLNNLLKKEGYEIFNEPLFDIIEQEYIIDNKNDIAAIIITSFYAVKEIIKSNMSRDITIFAVGKFSCKKLKDLGYKDIRVAKNNSAQSLLKLIIESHDNLKKASIYYFRGQDITIDFKKELSKRSLEITDVICYKAAARLNFSPKLLDFLKKNKFDEVLIYSRNSAKIFINLVERHNLIEYFKYSKILCLSLDIAKIIKYKENYFSNIDIFSNSKILNDFYD